MVEPQPPSSPSYLIDNPRFPFCKGCSHTNVLRRLNDALVACQVPHEKVVLVTDIGCIGLADALFKNIHTVHTTHGRSTAFATGIALADSVLADDKLKIIVLIGDGGAMIGLQHLVHAAMLNVNLTVLICNNFVYGMTGGQGSSFTPECFVTATTPDGNIVPPIDICGVLEKSHAPFLARATAMERNLHNLIVKAIQFPGFAAVEILELCTEYAVPSNELTGKRLQEIADENKWTLGIIKESLQRPVFRERYQHDGNGAQERPAPRRTGKSEKRTAALDRPVSLIIAGSAGEKVQSAASTLCKAAINSGLVTTQKNDNPVTQGTGFSLSEVWLSPKEIGYTGIEQPDFVIVTSEDGMREIESRRILDQLKRESKVYLDDSLERNVERGEVAKFPFRKLFGAERAMLGAISLAVRLHRLVDEQSLEEALSARLGDSYMQFMTLLRQMEAHNNPTM